MGKHEASANEVRTFLACVHFYFAVIDKITIDQYYEFKRKKSQRRLKSSNGYLLKQKSTKIRSPRNPKCIRYKQTATQMIPIKINVNNITQF